MYFSEQVNVDDDATFITILLVSFNLQSCCLMQSAVCSLRSAVYSLRSAVCSLPSANVVHRFVNVTIVFILGSSVIIIQMAKTSIFWPVLFWSILSYLNTWNTYFAMNNHACGMKHIRHSEYSLHGSRGTIIKQTLLAPCTQFLQKEREKQLTSV